MNEQDSKADIQRTSLPDVWDLVAEGYSRSTEEFFADFSTAGIAALRPTTSMRVLDLACGPGTTALKLSPLVEEIIALDFSPGMLRQLERNIAASGAKNIVPVLGDGHHLTYSEAEFDVVLSMFGVSFFSNRPRGLGESFRVLKPDGRALFATWVSDAGSSAVNLVDEVLAIAAPEPGLIEPQGMRLDPPGRLEKELTEVGFADVKISPIHRALEFDDVWDFWHVIVCGDPGIAALRAKVSADEWKERSNRAADHLKKKFGEKSIVLDARAIFATARKPA